MTHCPEKTSAITRYLLPALLILTFILSCKSNHPSLNTARIDISAPAMQQKEFLVSFSVNGSNFWANKKSFSFDNEGECTINIDKDECGLLLFNFNGLISRVIIAPGDHVKMIITTDGKKQSDITYTGSNAAGHQFFNTVKRASIQDVDNPYDADTSATEIIRKINARLGEECDILNRLLADGKITRKYETAAERDVRYYYAASQADAICHKYYFAVIRPKTKDAPDLFRKQYGDAWEQTFHLMPLDAGNAVASEYYRAYAHLYYEWYLGQFMPQKSKLIAKDTSCSNGLRRQDRVHIMNYAIIERNFKDSVAEFLKAEYIYYAMRRGFYEQSLASLYTGFIKQYPHSVYTSFLKIEADKIFAYLQTKDGDFAPDQQFISDYGSVNSLAALAGVLKDGPYYIDIWATSCAPCKEEFKHNTSLTALLHEYNVKPLYLSIDRDREDDDWKSMIKYFKLSGVHLRATDSLRKEIADKLGEGRTFTIPRYLIVNKDGIIINSDAARPSEQDALRVQLNKL